MKFAVAALLGVSSAVVLNNENQSKLYSEIALDDESFVMTEKIIEKGDGWIGWHPEMDKFPGTVNEYGNYKDAYTRVKPERFVGDSAETNYYPVDSFT